MEKFNSSEYNKLYFSFGATWCLTLRCAEASALLLQVLCCPSPISQASCHSKCAVSYVGHSRLHENLASETNSLFWMSRYPTLFFHSLFSKIINCKVIISYISCIVRFQNSGHLQYNPCHLARHLRQTREPCFMLRYLNLKQWNCHLNFILIVGFGGNGQQTHFKYSWFSCLNAFVAEVCY
jgi:hypothetical protein